MADIPALLGDLAAETAALRARVEGLGDAGWHTPTPAEGWDVADSVSHLAYFDEAARLALAEPATFADQRDDLSGGTAATPPDVVLGRRLGPAALLAYWHEAQTGLAEAVGAADPAVRVPWYGPSMGLASFVTARIMETWAHGQDVADALGLAPVVSSRLRHVCHIGVGARAWAFRVHRVADPGDPVRVEAGGPDGAVWSWGPEGATDRLSGPALDLAMVFTQRRHPADTSVVATGRSATAWLGVAQCFAGPPGPGRAPATPPGR